MTSSKEWKAKIKGWLIRKESGSDLLVDREWSIEETEDTLIASSEHSPYTIHIEFGEAFMSILVHTGIETATMPVNERLDLYRKILILNDEIMMMKVVLSGRNDEIVIRTDLDLASLGKEEFNDAIISVLVGAHGLRRIVSEFFDEGEDDADETINAIASALKVRSRAQVINMLVTQAGMDRDEAIQLVDQIIEAYSIHPPDPKGYA